MRIPKAILIHVISPFFLFEKSMDDQLLSGGHKLLQLCKWSEQDRQAIKARMWRLKVMKCLSTYHFTLPILYEYYLGTNTYTSFIPYKSWTIEFISLCVWRWKIKYRVGRRRAQQGFYQYVLSRWGKSI
jgi:hypothetical protein